MLLVILTDSPEHPIRYFCFMLLPQVLICPVGLLSPFSSGILYNQGERNTIFSNQ